MGHALISPLNWGLGHASRCIPVIREMLRSGNEVTIAACGNALIFLEKEFPDCSFIRFQDYPPPYNPGRLFFPRFTLHMNTLVQSLATERKCLERILSQNQYDLIISDSRPGVYSNTIPSLQITHQVQQSFPLIVWPIELIGVYLNIRVFRKFSGIIIPDNPPGDNALAGKLSRTPFRRSRTRYYYAGILASVQKQPLARDIDFLMMISGMEPQRTALERILIPQISELPGKKIAILGKPASGDISFPDDSTQVYSSVSNEEKSLLMSRSKFIISRSGYTTMMDVAELDLRQGLFIPTPGQWEQEYLAGYYKKKGWFMSKSQYHLQLAEDVNRAKQFGGFPDMSRTEVNVRRLYEIVLANYLER